MNKTPDVVNLDKSHVSFCGKAFRFRREIERSLHETKSEFSRNKEDWVHETKSEFVEGRGERCTKLSRNSSRRGKEGRTKPSRNSSRRGGRCRTKPSRKLAKGLPPNWAGEGEGYFPRRGAKPFAQKKYPRKLRRELIIDY